MAARHPRSKWQGWAVNPGGLAPEFIYSLLLMVPRDAEPQSLLVEARGK